MRHANESEKDLLFKLDDVKRNNAVRVPYKLQQRR